MHKPKSQWRTWSGILLLGGMILGAVWMCTPETRAAVASTAIPALSSLGLWLAGKAGWEHHTTSKAPVPPA